MEIKNYRVMRQTLWIAQGLAIAALCAGPGPASATPMLSHITPHFGKQYRYDWNDSQPSYQEGNSTAGQDRGTNSGDLDHGAGDWDHGAGDGDQNGWWRDSGDHSLVGDSDDPGSDAQGTPTAVPEPGTLALFFVGLAALGIASARRLTGRGAARTAARLAAHR